MSDNCTDAIGGMASEALSHIAELIIWSVRGAFDDKQTSDQPDASTHMTCLEHHHDD